MATFDATRLLVEYLLQTTAQYACHIVLYVAEAGFVINWLSQLVYKLALLIHKLAEQVDQ